MAFHPKGFICFVSEPDETVLFSSSATGDDLDFESEDIFSVIINLHFPLFSDSSSTSEAKFD